MLRNDFRSLCIRAWMPLRLKMNVLMAPLTMVIRTMSLHQTQLVARVAVDFAKCLNKFSLC